MAVGRDEHIGCVVSVEVHFGITGHVHVLELVSHLHAQARELRAGAELGEMTLYRVAERNLAEVRADHVGGIGGTKDVLKVHKAARRKLGAADTE